jgi:DUF2934 family protein
MKARVAKTAVHGIEVGNPVPSSAELERLIAEAAYYRSERRGFAPGQEVDDWLEAEKEVRHQVSAGARTS